MKNSFIKDSFINALNTSISSIEEVKSAFKNELPTEKVSKGVLYNLVNRKEYLKETCETLNSDKQNIVFLSGFLGTGKTEFINTIVSALEENVFDFYYECSAITHLDDIILSLFNYLKKISSINPEYNRTFKITNSQSIDERLMNSIKTLDKPLLIVIDGFENLISDNFTYNQELPQTEEQNELIHFIEFISSLPQIKIILSGQKICISPFSNDSEKIFEIKLGGLDEQESQKILRDNGIIETESCFNQIFQVTRGYPENLLWFSTFINLIEISPFTLMQEYFSQNASFQEFIYQKFYELIPKDYNKILCFFEFIRHSLTIETLKKLDFTPDIVEKTEYLLSRMILTQNRDRFYIKKLLKSIIYSHISLDEKKQLHRYLYELYSEQISKKLEERIFPISRKLLYSEQYFHYMSLINYGDKSLPDLKTTTLSNLKPDYKYLYTNITDSLFTGEANLHELPQAVDEQIDIHHPNEQISTEPDREIINIAHVKEIEIINVDDFNIELSEEEKALLTEENSEKKPLKSEHEEIKFPTELSAKAEMLKNEGHALFEEGKFDESIKKFDESLILYEILRDKQAVNRILSSIANAYNECFRHDVALMYYHKILSSEDKGLESELKINAYCNIADIYNYRENFDTAIKFYEKSLIEAEKQNNIKQISKISFKKALVWDDQENFDKALEFYLKNTEISQDTEINPYIAASYSNIAAIYEEREDMELALKYFQESLKYDKLMNNNEGQYETLSNIGNLYFELESYPKANDYFHEALDIARQAKDVYKIAMSCLDIGDIYLQENNYEKALKAFIQAGKTIERTISTDSREKIDRRFKTVINEIGEKKFRELTEKLRKKHD